MTIDSIKNGIVIDHIKAGKGMYLYEVLGLEKLDCSVAIIKNVASKKMGKKDIIKIDSMIDLDLDVLGYVDSGITVNIIRDGKTMEKKSLELPERILRPWSRSFRIYSSLPTGKKAYTDVYIAKAELKSK